MPWTPRSSVFALYGAHCADRDLTMTVSKPLISIVGSFYVPERSRRLPVKTCDAFKCPVRIPGRAISCFCPELRELRNINHRTFARQCFLAVVSCRVVRLLRLSNRQDPIHWTSGAKNAWRAISAIWKEDVCPELIGSFASQRHMITRRYGTKKC